MRAEGEVSGETPAGIFLTWLRAFLFVLAILLFDPFGLSQGADRLSERLIMAAWAPWLSAPPDRAEKAQAAQAGRWAKGVDRLGQRAITVVLIDDKFLRRYGESQGARETWPISRLAQYDLVLEPILDAAPAALFVDYVFHAESAGGTEDLGEMAGALFERLAVDPVLAGMRVLLAERPSRSRTDRRTGCSFRLTEPELLTWQRQGAQAVVALAETLPQVELVATRFWGPSDRYPLAPLAVGEEGEAPEDCAPFEPDRRLIASPALALFVRWCQVPANRAANDFCGAFREAPKPPQGAATRFTTEAAPQEAPHRGFRPYLHEGERALTASVPQWLWYPSNAMRNALFNPNAVQRRGATPHPCLAVDAKGRLASTAAAVRPRVPGVGDEAVEFNRCIAIDTISALDLGRLGGGLSDAALEGLLKDRLVLVGVDLDGAPDFVFNPVNGQVPGVLLHAAALENLISDGARRSREAPTLMAGLSAGLMLALVLAAISSVPVSRLALMRGWTGWPVVLFVTVASVLLPFFLAMTLYGLTNLAPANWVSAMAAKLTMLGGFVAYLKHSDLRFVPDFFDGLGERIRQTLDRLSRVARLLLALAAFGLAMATAAWPVPMLIALGFLALAVMLFHGLARL